MSNAHLDPMARRLVQAIERGVSQHGLPNGFMPGELEREYGGPRASMIGLLLRYHRDMFDAYMPAKYLVTYGCGGDGRMVVRVSAAATATTVTIVVAS